MSTEITVVVGADGLLKRDQSTRNARRRDRLDSEALRDQVKAKAQEEDKSKGFNNKKDEYDPSRDPAAHARKGVPVGGFTTCKIRQVYKKESKSETPTGNFNYGGGKFMDIFIQGIKEDGNLGNEVEINLERNRLCSEFNISESIIKEHNNDVYPSSYNPFPPGSKTYRRRPYFRQLNYYLPNQQIRFGFNQCYTQPQPNGYVRVDETIWFSDSYFTGTDGEYIVPTDNFPGSFDYWNHYVAYGEGWDGVDGNYSNDPWHRQISLGDIKDIQGELGMPGYEDPGYQLFILPLNDNHAYVVILYTDVEISFKGFGNWTGTMDPYISMEGQPPNPYNDPERFYDYCVNTYCRITPEPKFWIPPCFELNDDISPPSVTLSSSALNLLQQVKVVELKEGNAKLFSDKDIPDKLKRNIKSLMPVSGDVEKSFDGRYNFLSTAIEHTTRWRLWNETGGGGVSPFFLSQEEMADNYVIKEVVIPWWSFLKLDFVNRDEKSSYASSQARARSLAKGYGFGFLETANHFDSLYVDPGEFSFAAESNYLANDPIFTPAIFCYISGVATPSLNYSEVLSGISSSLAYDDPEVLPKKFVTIDRVTKAVSAVEIPKDLSNSKILEPFSKNLVAPSEEIPMFIRASHYAWNWDNPELCWQKLIDLGFEAGIIGPKPDNPTDE